MGFAWPSILPKIQSTIDMRLDHPDFTFERQKEERRRRQLVPPALKRKAPSWKISGHDKKPPERWRSEFDSSGRLVLLEEVVPPSLPPDGPIRPHARSRFEIILGEGCMVAGHAAEAGTKVICFAPTAGLLAGRGKVIAEEMNAF